jgi:RNA polymerase sigma factor (sigma-70 family)
MSPTALDEDKLARDARSGDQRALAKIFSDYHQPLYRYCLAIVGDRQEAEDALQETMVKALRSLPGEKREIALRPWLYRIAHNESIDQLRRRRKNLSLADAAPAPGGGLAEQVEVRERLRQLISDLGVLPERQRGVLLMREAAGLDFDEIAAALETTSAVARQTLYEARLGLREMDAGREMDCAAVTRALSDGDGRVRRRRDIRAHLRDCSGCRGFAEEIDSRRAELAAIAPLPAAVAAGLLHGVLGGGAGAGAGAGGIGGLAAGAATKSVGTAALLKGAAAVAVVALVGVGAADKSGWIDLGGPHPAPLPRSSSSVQPAESDPGSTGGESADTSSDEAGLGSARRTNIDRARARRRLDAASAVRPRPQERSGSEGTDSPDSPPANQESSAAETHASPDAAPGQQTAAGNHAAHEAKAIPAGKGAAGHPAHPTHPSHASHPTHPTHPEKPVKEAKSPAVTEVPPAPAAEHAATPPGKGK